MLYGRGLDRARANEVVAGQVHQHVVVLGVDRVDSVLDRPVAMPSRDVEERFPAGVEDALDPENWDPVLIDLALDLQPMRSRQQFGDGRQSDPLDQRDEFAYRPKMCIACSLVLTGQCGVRHDPPSSRLASRRQLAADRSSAFHREHHLELQLVASTRPGQSGPRPARFPRFDA